MNEAELEKWSETLMELRQERMTLAQKEFEARGGAYSASDFFTGAASNIDRILSEWMTQQQGLWDAHIPEDPSTALAAIKDETESLIDLEVEAVQRDLEHLQQETNWDDASVTNGQLAFDGTIGELRNKYQLKLASFQGVQKKKSSPPAPTAIVDKRQKVRYSGGSSGGSGSGMLFMLIVGILLGSAPSFYFWDINHKTEMKFNVEKTKLEAAQKNMEDGFALLRDVFSQMASGKMSSMVDMEDRLTKLKNNKVLRRDRIEQEFAAKREKLMKKNASGNEMDQELEDLEYEKIQALGEAKAKDDAEIDKLEKQIKIIKELLAG